MLSKNSLILILALLIILGAIFYLESVKTGGSGEVTSDIISTMGVEEKEKLYTKAKEIDPTYGFINTDGITDSGTDW